MLTWSPDQCKALVNFTGRQLGDLIGDSVDPMMVICFPCLLLPVQPNDIELLRNPANREVMLRLVDDHLKRVGVPPSVAALVRVFKTTQGVKDLPTSGVSKTRDSSNLGVPAARPAMVDSEGRALWYHTEKAKTAKVRCQCTGNCLTTCPARGQHAHCPNKAEALKTLARKSIYCEACRCREAGCWLIARRPFGKHSLTMNYGKCKRHWTAK